MDLEKLIQHATILDNNGYYDEAAPLYQELFKRRNILDLHMLERMAQFFSRTGKQHHGFITAKLAIELGGSFSVFLPIYFNGFPYYESDKLNALNWLLTQPGIEKNAEAMLAVSKNYVEMCEWDKSYFAALKSVRLAEKLLLDSDEFAAAFHDSILQLVRLEHEFKEYGQARFQLKKLIYLQPHLVVRKAEIARWAAVLDLFPDLLFAPVWDELRAQLTGDLEMVAGFYEALFKKADPSLMYDKLVNYEFADAYLQHKKHVYMAILAKGLGKPVSTQVFEESLKAIPGDLLASLFYYDLLIQKDKTKANEFFQTIYRNHRDRREILNRLNSVTKPTSAGTAAKAELENVSVTFFGGGEKIGGTSILIRAGESAILLDAGMHLHGSDYIPDYRPLEEMGMTFDDIDALLVTHAHLDHTGAVPYIKKQCPDIRIFATAPTQALMKVLLEDTVKRANGNDLAAELYDESDLNIAIHSIEHASYNISFNVPSKKGKDWKVTYYRAGHILGAASILLEIGGVRMLFTGDFSLAPQKTVSGLTLPDDLDVDILITESTYGFLPMESSDSRERQERLLQETVDGAIRSDGNILIPAFSLGRSQEVILMIKEMFNDTPFLPFDVYLDGKVVEICRIYQSFADKEQYFNRETVKNKQPGELFFGHGVRSAKDIYRRNSKFTDTPFEDFYDYYISGGGKCIISSSGMLLDQSASARYAEKMLEDSKNAIVFTGYLDEESPGFKIRQLIDQPEGEITINGRPKRVNAQISSVRLSAHASREDIAELIVKLKPAKVFLMHGEHETRFRPIRAAVEGVKIYPSLIELLEGVNNGSEVIPAFNGKTYSF